jgi:hypothetical protein
MIIYCAAFAVSSVDQISRIVPSGNSFFDFEERGTVLFSRSGQFCVCMFFPNDPIDCGFVLFVITCCLSANGGARWR